MAVPLVCGQQERLEIEPGRKAREPEHESFRKMGSVWNSTPEFSGLLVFLKG